MDAARSSFVCDLFADGLGLHHLISHIAISVNTLGTASHSSAWLFVYALLMLLQSVKYAVAQVILIEALCNVDHDMH